VYLFEQLIPATARDLESNFKIPNSKDARASTATQPITSANAQINNSNASLNSNAGMMSGSGNSIPIGNASSASVVSEAHEGGWLSEVKKAGINCRHLGYFRKCLTSEYWRRVVLVECMARALVCHW
jgi:hypothetical protein